MDEEFLISICLPTYNRANFIGQTIKTIVDQFKNDQVAKQVEFVILDNISSDNTEEVVKKNIKDYQNVSYIKDVENRNIAGGQIQAAKLAKGKYIWFFSDDDLLSLDAISEVIKIVRSGEPDTVFCNTASFIEQKTTSENNFGIDSNYLNLDKNDLFKFVQDHFYCNNYFFTFMSNYIVKKSLFNESLQNIEKYNSKLDLFPFHIPYYYSKNNYKASIVGKPIVLYRENNTSWGPADALKHAIFTDQIVRNHLKNIIKFNKKYILSILLFKIKLDSFLNQLRIFILKARKNNMVNDIYLFLRSIIKKYDRKH